MDELEDWLGEGAEEAGARAPGRGTRALDQRAIWRPIRDLAPRDPVQLPPSATVREAVRVLREHGIGCVLVSEDGRLTGILTERDLLLKLDPTTLDVPLRGLMTPDPEVLALDDPIVYALNKMSVGGFRHVPLVDDDHRPVGIVSVKDIVQYVVDVFASDVLTVAPAPPRGEVWRGRDGG